MTIAGVAFGGEAGFLVGAMTGFVSNMFSSNKSRLNFMLNIIKNADIFS